MHESRTGITCLDGLHGVKVTYEPLEARVQFDPSLISSGLLADAGTNAGTRPK